MSIGTRSNFNTLITQNMLLESAVSDRSPILHRFCTKVLSPTFKCVEADCGTTIGRVMSVPETDPRGLISLDTNAVITRDYLVSVVSQGIYTIRVRDTSTCTSIGGFCARCGRGYNARVNGTDTYPTVGSYYKLTGSAAAYQNYIAQRPAGSLLGYSVLPSDPLPSVPENWKALIRDREVEKMISILVGMGLPVDTSEYLLSISDRLELALAIVAYYGVYGYVI